MRATSPMPGQSSDPIRMTPSCPHHPGSLVRRVRIDDANPAGMASLSPRERDVLDDAASGLSVIETAAKRIKSTETVKSQRKSIMLKLDARNMTEAVALTMREPRGMSDAGRPTNRELLA